MIAIDARWMIGPLRGMARHAHTIIQQSDRKIILLTPTGCSRTQHNPITYLLSFFPVWEQIYLPILCKIKGISHLICPYNTAPIFLGKSINLTLIVHDLIFLESLTDLPLSGSPYQTFGRIYRRFIVPKAINRANQIITVSKYSETKLINILGDLKTQVVLLPNSLPDLWFDSEVIPLNSRDPFILAVVGEAPSKNLKRLIEAFALFKDISGKQGENVILRIVGVKKAHLAPFRALCSRLEVTPIVEFEGYLNDNDLKELYSRASLVVLPSLYEGFGIPLIEAMARATPIACSNTSSLPEVAGAAGWFFDPRDVDDMAYTLVESFTDDAERARKVNLGLTWSRQYSSSIIGSKIKEFWEKL